MGAGELNTLGSHFVTSLRPIPGPQSQLLENSAWVSSLRSPWEVKGSPGGSWESQTRRPGKYQIWYQPREEQKGACPWNTTKRLMHHMKNSTSSSSGQPCYLIPPKTKDKGWHCISTVTQAINQVMVCGFIIAECQLKQLEGDYAQHLDCKSYRLP